MIELRADSVRAHMFKFHVLLRKRILSGEVRPVADDDEVGWQEPSDDEAQAGPMRKKRRLPFYLGDLEEYHFTHHRFNVD